MFFLEEIKIALHCLACLLNTPLSTGKGVYAACHDCLLIISVPNYILRSLN